jgi:hypothetical protein
MLQAVLDLGETPTTEKILNTYQNVLVIFIKRLTALGVVVARSYDTGHASTISSFICRSITPSTLDMIVRIPIRDPEPAFKRLMLMQGWKEYTPAYKLLTDAECKVMHKNNEILNKKAEKESGA